METVQFKTNINCGGCVAKVTPVLNKETGIKHWAVDTNSPHKILTIEKDGISQDEIMTAIKKTGFQIEPMVK